MPAPLAPLIGFVLGIAFAWAGADELPRSQPSSIGSRALVVVALFATLVFAPIASYFLAFESDWSYAYFLDTAKVPSALHLALVLADAASIPVGFFVASRPARARKLRALLLMAVPPLLVVVAAMLTVMSRLSIQGTYAQYHGDFGTRPLAGSSLGWGLLWMDSLLALGVAWTHSELRRFGRATQLG